MMDATPLGELGSLFVAAQLHTPAAAAATALISVVGVRFSRIGTAVSG